MAHQNSDQKHYWFPAKTHGWGWGLPSAWQGWSTLLIYTGALVFSASLYPPAEEKATFIVCAVILTIVLLVICSLKGEPQK